MSLCTMHLAKDFVNIFGLRRSKFPVRLGKISVLFQQIHVLNVILTIVP